MEIENVFRSTALAVGLMGIEFIPLYRASRGAEALGYARQSPPARAIPDYFFKDHKPSASQGEARLRGL